MPRRYDVLTPENRQPDGEQIRARAYQYYLERDCEDGHDLEDWLRAEAELSRELDRAA